MKAENFLCLAVVVMVLQVMYRGSAIDVAGSYAVAAILYWLSGQAWARLMRWARDYEDKHAGL